MVISSELINYSLKNLWSQKSRSFLTVFSILIGITTIFIFLSFGIGLFAYVNEVTEGSSADKIIVQAKSSGAPGLDDTFKLTDDDLRAVERTAGVFEATGAYFKVAKVEQNKESKYTFLMGYDPREPLIMDVFGVGIEEGKWLSSGDSGKVLLGYNYMIPGKIFTKGYRVNDKINIQGKDLRIVGFLESVGSPQDDAQVYVTSDYIDKLYPGTDSYGWIVARVDINNIDDVVEKVEKNLRKERDLEEGKEDFFVQSFNDMIASYSVALNGIIGFIILIALVSIVVSAVNTANTMVTSVLERYKEIGVMKSIGAKNSEILKIFVFESSFLGFVAGVLGVAFGWLIGYGGGVLLDNLGWGFLSPAFPIELIVGAILFATVTGLLSGIVPAVQASKINAVDALRYE
jgi:putative ABC transport system permease protein